MNSTLTVRVSVFIIGPLQNDIELEVFGRNLIVGAFQTFVTGNATTVHEMTLTSDNASVDVA